MSSRDTFWTVVLLPIFTYPATSTTLHHTVPRNWLIHAYYCSWHKRFMFLHVLRVLSRNELGRRRIARVKRSELRRHEKGFKARSELLSAELWREWENNDSDKSRSLLRQWKVTQWWREWRTRWRDDSVKTLERVDKIDLEGWHNIWQFAYVYKQMIYKRTLFYELMLSWSVYIPSFPFFVFKFANEKRIPFSFSKVK